MKLLTTLAFWLVLLGGAEAEMARPPATPGTRSISGQFLAFPPTARTDPKLVTQLTGAGNYVQLDASLLVVSCERIKQLLWRRLGSPPSWRGRVYLQLRAARSGNESVTLVSERFLDGWRYRVQLPDLMERERFVSAIVRVLLLEIANRRAEDRSTEIPLWLVEGFSQELLATGDAAGELKIILPPPTVSEADLKISRLKLNERRTNSLYWAHIVLCSQPPLTFEELSWPADNQLSTSASEIYQSCAQLFVTRLLEFPDGPASFRNFLGRLPKQLNWQLVFLEAFQDHFKTMMDVEKWWAVQMTDFTGRELTETWSSAKSWQKLDEILRPPAQVRTGPGVSPLRTEVSLQTLLREPNGIEQAQFYRQTLQSLDALRLRAAPNLVSLVDAYRQAIANYLRRQDKASPFLGVRKFFGLTTNKPTRDLIQQLDALEPQRQALRPLAPGPDAHEQEAISAAFR